MSAFDDAWWDGQIGDALDHAKHAKAIATEIADAARQLHGLDLEALERGQDLAVAAFKAAHLAGDAALAAAWEALLVASGHGWPAFPRAATEPLATRQ